MSATVKSLFAILSLSTMCTILSSSHISYNGPAAWEMYREFSSELEDADAKLLLFCERYWKETEKRKIRSDWRVFNTLRIFGSDPKIIMYSIFEQRIKEEAVKKTLEGRTIKALEEHPDYQQLSEESLCSQLTELKINGRSQLKKIRNASKQKRNELIRDSIKSETSRWCARPRCSNGVLVSRDSTGRSYDSNRADRSSLARTINVLVEKNRAIKK